MSYYSRQPLQLDIFTYGITTPTNRKLTFLSLPREIRDEIYSYVIEEEQTNQREYVGKHSNSSKSQFCTPLFKVRPPPLIRVCRTIRAEYLPFFFRETCFRVYVDVGKHVTPEHISSRGTTLNKERVTIDKPTENWLNSIRISDDAVFRNLQFRLTYQGGVPVGASFNLTYNAQTRKYQCEFVLDDGWNVRLEIESNHNVRNKAALMPHCAWHAVREACRRVREEFLDWHYIQQLVWLLDPIHCHKKLGPGIVWNDRNRELRDWSGEAELGEGPAYIGGLGRVIRCS